MKTDDGQRTNRRRQIMTAEHNDDSTIRNADYRVGICVLRYCCYHPPDFLVFFLSCRVVSFGFVLFRFGSSFFCLQHERIRSYLTQYNIYVSNILHKTDRQTINAKCHAWVACCFSLPGSCRIIIKLKPCHEINLRLRRGLPGLEPVDTTK